MASGEPTRQPEVTPAGAQLPRQTDPWGVKRAENLLTSLQGVLSARVVVSGSGEITEVHVLTNAGVTPKQMVRNVESALLAHLGLKVDHRKISIAQTADVRPIEALEQETVRAEALRRGVVFKAIDIATTGNQRVTIRVTLGLYASDDVSGEEEVADTARARIRGAARATARALDKILPAGTLELEGVREMEAFDAAFMAAGVHVIEGRETRLLVGTAEVKESPERAAALALLDATNRWVQSRR